MYMGIEVEASVVETSTNNLVDLKTELASLGGSLPVPSYGSVTTDVFQAEFVTIPSMSVAKLVLALREMVEAMEDYLEGGIRIEYNPYEERPLEQVYVLSHPHMSPRVRAFIDALRVEAGRYGILDALMGLARACSTHTHLGCMDGAGKTRVMSDEGLRHLALTLVNVFSNAGPYMAEWFVTNLGVQDDMRRRRLWHEVTLHSPLRTPQSGVMHLSWEAYVQSVCERGPRLVATNEKDACVVDLSTPADFNDLVVRKTVWDPARLSYLGTVECRFLPTAPPEKVGRMAEMVMVTATTIERYLESRRIETMKGMEALFLHLSRETAGFVPKKPLTPAEWLKLTLG